MKRNRHGFTLIELLVVIAILVLLVAIMSPSFVRARARVRVAMCASNLHQLHMECHMYSNNNAGALMMGSGNGRYSTMIGAGYFASDLLKARNGNVGWFRWGVLYTQGYLEGLEIAYCPQHLEDGWAEWSAVKHAGTIFTSYEYNPVLNGPSHKYHNMTQLLPDTPIMSDQLCLNTQGSIAHRLYPGWNITRADGSTSFIVDQPSFDVIPTDWAGYNIALHNMILAELAGLP